MKDYQNTSQVRGHEFSSAASAVERVTCMALRCPISDSSRGLGGNWRGRVMCVVCCRGLAGHREEGSGPRPSGSCCIPVKVRHAAGTPRKAQRRRQPPPPNPAPDGLLDSVPRKLTHPSWNDESRTIQGLSLISRGAPGKTGDHSAGPGSQSAELTSFKHAN